MATGTTPVKGQFTGASTSSTITGRKIKIIMDVTGTASVDIEEQLPTGNWIKIATAITADYSQVFDSPVICSLRLNNTAGAGPVDYAMFQGDGE